MTDIVEQPLSEIEQLEQKIRQQDDCQEFRFYPTADNQQGMVSSWGVQSVSLNKRVRHIPVYYVLESGDLASQQTDVVIESVYDLITGALRMRDA